MKSLLKYALLSVTFILVHSMSATTTEPRLVVGELPEYPEAAQVKNLCGTVIVEALVDENGNVFAAEVVQAVHKTLDTAALEAVSNWTFEPAKEDGKAVMKVVQVPVAFKLLDPTKKSLMESQSRALAKK